MDDEGQGVAVGEWTPWAACVLLGLALWLVFRWVRAGRYGFPRGVIASACAAAGVVLAPSVLVRWPSPLDVLQLVLLGVIGWLAENRVARQWTGDQDDR